MNGPKTIADVDFEKLTNRNYTPSPASWSDQILYFLMLDRFFDANERGGYRNANDKARRDRHYSARQ